MAAGCQSASARSPRSNGTSVETCATGTPTQHALVADANELERTGLSFILKRDLRLRSVHEVASRQDLVDRLGALPTPALAIIDPDLLDPEWACHLRRLRRQSPGTRLVLLGSNAHRSEILAALAAGVHGYLPRCLAAQEMVRALANVLNGEIFVPASLAEPEPQPAEEVVAILGAHPRDATEILSKLTPRQHDVFRLLIEGHSNKAIARTLRLAEGTVKVHVNGLYRLLNVHCRIDVIRAIATIVPRTHEAIEHSAMGQGPMPYP